MVIKYGGKRGSFLPLGLLQKDLTTMTENGMFYSREPPNFEDIIAAIKNLQHK